MVLLDYGFVSVSHLPSNRDFLNVEYSFLRFINREKFLKPEV